MKHLFTISFLIFCFILPSCKGTDLEPIEFGGIHIEYEIPQNGGNVFIDIQNRYTTSVKTDSLGYKESGRYLYNISNQDENFYEGVYFIYIYLDDEIIVDGRRFFQVDY